ncbi:energy-coupling factor ABC transporter ATP-binding protein [Stappia sp. ES.058]|uniref:energy-coupling factor ABC transporter ATP-binding protein n=1 Tax=Stappia sp. ES.058 TaxID=1881061 RepID=UPI0008794D5A|nr:ABC transporter ATP-binding protein [Stappia sp. ES.058]SDU37489.1 biotin transport system ATP-binding protein [Stappia sp. ES.058]
MSSENTVLSLHAVSLRRGDRSLFRALSLTLSEARVGIIGFNGSGKSSFLRLLNGLLLPDTGDVTVLGMNTRKDRKALPRHVGMVFQNPDHQIIFPTVEEELAFGLKQFGETQAAANRSARACLSDHGCADWADRPTSSLSEGQKQLVCLMASTLTKPRILLCDEPFSGLDPALRMHFRARLRDAAECVCLVSHDMDDLREMDRVIWFDKGAVAGDGAPDEVLREYALAAQTRARTLSVAEL